MKQLCVWHYHFRPGGVRSVIEAGLPALAAAGGFDTALMAAGEAADDAWREWMESRLYPCRVRWLVEPAFGYWSEQDGAVEEAVTRIRGQLPALTSGVLWAHNLSVGRNWLMAREVSALPESAAVWLHHHDWWWDGRWERWPELEGLGMGSLECAAACSLPAGPQFRHFSVNAAEARRLTEWSGLPVHFLPNPFVPQDAGPREMDAAREFLRSAAAGSPVWLYPCRALRRKNIAEALLVLRWVLPEAMLVTTGGASSGAERAAWESLCLAAQQHAWPLVPEVCRRGDAPPVNALLAAADGVIATSLKEGFGLVWQEAAAAARPLLARVPAGLEETLAACGISWRAAWDALWIDPEWFDADAESGRRLRKLEPLAALLPEPFRWLTRKDPLLSSGPVDFGSLTLAGQLEVLSQPSGSTRRRGMEWNAGLLHPAVPVRPRDGHSAASWAAALLRMAGTRPPGAHGSDFAESAERFIEPAVRQWLRQPLLWPEG